MKNNTKNPASDLIDRYKEKLRSCVNPDEFTWETLITDAGYTPELVEKAKKEHDGNIDAFMEIESQEWMDEGEQTAVSTYKEIINDLEDLEVLLLTLIAV